jgi:RNA polymerase sigma-32 factor
VNALRRYSRDVQANPMLPPAEQETLAQRFARDRNPADAQRLVLANLRLVITIAKSLGGSDRADLMDLVQEGNAGLMVAIDRFDPERGSKLSAYASIWIRAFVLRHIMDTRQMVRATTREGRRRFFARALPTDLRLDGPTGREPDDGGGRASRLDFFADDDGLRPDVLAEEQEGLQRLQSAVTRFETTLDARQRAILADRWFNESPVPLRELGATIDLSGERVRQLEQGMLTRLRALVMDAPSALNMPAAA